ncbi:16S rRNA methyltransferase, partial [Pseudoalteromonas sp. S983]
MSRLANPSLLLLRNEEELTGERILVINTMRDGFLRELKQLNPNSDIHAFSYNVAAHQDSQKHKGITSHVGHSLPVLEELDLIIYYY